MVQFTRRGALALFAAASASAALSKAVAQSPGATRVHLVLTNDVYRMGELNGRGGLARLAAAVKAERARSGVTTFFAHAGDAFSPSLMSGFDQGRHMVDLLNLFPPDVFAPGNHEFDFGKANYLKRVEEAKFRFLAANLRAADGSVLPKHADVWMAEAGPLKIGFVGGALEATPTVSKSEDLKFLPTVDTVREQAAKLRQQGADLVVAVIHAEKRDAARLMETRAVDVILLGHNHDLHLEYDGKVALAESGEDAQFVTVLELAIEAKGEGASRRVSWWPNFNIIDSGKLTPDPDVLARVRSYEAELSKELDVEIAVLGAPLDTRSGVIRRGEAGFGNFIADAIRASTGADCAIVNSGGIRGNTQYVAGFKLRRRDILTELPFPNKVVATRVTGAGIRAALEHGFSRLPETDGRFPQVSGIKAVLDPGAPVGSRVVSLEIAGAPVDPARVYSVATNDFMARGGDGYTGLISSSVKITDDSGGAFVSNDVMAYARKIGTIDAKPEGRITLK